MEKVCAHCGEKFETNNPQKMYCNRPHYRPCPVCGIPVLMIDNDFSRKPKCCSSKCTHIQRQRRFKPKICVFCGDEFYPKSGVQTVCDKVHYDKCEICGKQFVRTPSNKNDGVTTCSRECTLEKMRRHSQLAYGTNHPMQSAAVQEHFHQSMERKYGEAHALRVQEILDRQQATAYETNMRDNGVPYACMLPQCMEANGHIVSKVNLRMRDRLVTAGCVCGLERRLDNRSFDIVIEDTKTLIEIDPTFTHSLVKTARGGNKPPLEHINKTNTAYKYGYRCIHVWDWDDTQKVVYECMPRIAVPVDQFTVYKLTPSAANEFLAKYDFQGSCRGQLLCIGLVKDDEIYQVMTFGKAKYDKDHHIQLMRMCTRPGYEIVGGYDKLSSEATDFGLYDIIAYSDISKGYNTDLEKLGMKRIRVTPPREIWSKGTQYITDSLLQSQGAHRLLQIPKDDRCNDQVLIEDGWLPIMDCGREVFSSK